MNINLTAKAIRFSLFIILALLAAGSEMIAAPVVRTVVGPDANSILGTVNQFRTDLGGANNGVGGSFQTGRREINWDAVPDTFAAPNFLPSNFFNTNSPRGAVFSSNTTFSNTSAFLVSADSSNPTNTPVRFADIDASYSASFAAFSPERLFIARNSNITDVSFFIPGTNIPATVSGFGAVFTDVDQSGPTYIKYYGVNGAVLTFQSAPVANNGLSFVGVSFNAGERISRVEVISGNLLLANGNIDGGGNDVVAMDDFIYGEPRAAEYHASDFDGDGVADKALFRPSTGNWFILNSGSNTVRIDAFGLNGDIPVEGDFDGDSKSDLAIYRPNEGIWFILNSSNSQAAGFQFGAPGDKAVPGDYDKDRRTDLGVFRPSTGQWITLNSTTNFAQASFTQFGAAGDIPTGTAGN